MKKFICVGLIIITLFVTSGCGLSQVVQYKKHRNKNYLEHEEIYNKYLYIKEALEDEDELTQSDIIEVVNAYKKVFNSIDYIDSMQDYVNWHVVDTLPSMDGFYTDMQEQIINLVIENKVLKIPEEAVRFQQEMIVESYLTYTEYFDVRDIVIIKDTNNPSAYYVLSNKGDFFFCVYISTDEDQTLSIETSLDSADEKLCIANIEQVASSGISLVDYKKQIPVIKVNLTKESED